MNKLRQLNLPSYVPPCLPPPSTSRPLPGSSPRCPFGHLDKERILAELAGEEKEDLLAWLDLCLIAMDQFLIGLLPYQDIVFGRDAGEWMINTRSDYRAVYRELTEDQNNK